MTDPSSFEQMTLKELRALASEYELRGVSGMRKADLVAQLTKAERLASLKVGELRALAREVGLEEARDLKKKVLIGRLVAAEQAVEAPVVEMPPPPAEEPVREKPPPPAEEPERRPRPPLASYLLRISGALGMLVTLFALVAIPLLALRLGSGLRGGVRNGADQVRTVILLLRSAEDGLSTAADSIRTSTEALDAIGENLENTGPLLDSIGEVVGTEAPEMIEATHRALVNAQEGAQAIDQVLRGLATLGPLTGVTYDPQMPLQESLAEVASGLEPLPAAMRGVQEDLQTASSDLDVVGGSAASVAGSLTLLADDLNGVEQALSQQSEALESLAAGLENTADRVSLGVIVATIAVELLLAWIGITQYAVFILGSHLAQDRS